MNLRCLLLLVTSLLWTPGLSWAGDPSFEAGSLIIPMDIGTATDATGQNHGMLRAHGLVHELLRHRITVTWVINPDKPAMGNDFIIATVVHRVERRRRGGHTAVVSRRTIPYIS